jgi:hypothetical protein
MLTPVTHVLLLSRRVMLCRAGPGFGTWALLDLIQPDGLLAAENPLAAYVPHAPARAKHFIFLFMQGGPSHMNAFDPKPLLNKLHGQPVPPTALVGLQLQFTKSDAAILGSPQSCRKCGQSGIENADTYPHLQTCADDLAVVRSCYHESFNHAPALYMLNSGSPRMQRFARDNPAAAGIGS